MTDHLGRLLLVTPEAARVDADLFVLGARRSRAELLAQHRRCRAWHGPPGLRPPTHALQQAGLASHLLHGRDGALAHERDGHGVGANAVARRPGGGVGGNDQGLFVSLAGRRTRMPP